MDKKTVKEIALANGFKLKEQPGGTLELNPYVYVFSDKLVEHQQSKVDELQKQLIDQGQRFNEQSQRVKDLEHKNDELQKRINDSQDIIESILARSLDNPEIQDLCGQLIDVLEQALKGGGDASN